MEQPDAGRAVGKTVDSKEGPHCLQGTLTVQPGLCAENTGPPAPTFFYF